LARNAVKSSTTGKALIAIVISGYANHNKKHEEVTNFASFGFLGYGATSVYASEPPPATSVGSTNLSFRPPNTLVFAGRHPKRASARMALLGATIDCATKDIESLMAEIAVPGNDMVEEVRAACLNPWKEQSGFIPSARIQ